MSEVSTRRRSLEEYQVIDCDVHMMMSEETQQKIASHMDEPYRTQYHPDKGTLTGTAPSSGYPVTIPGEWHGVTREISDPEEDINVPLCEEFDVDIPLLNMGTRDPDSVPEESRGIQEMKALNNVLLEHFLDEHNHFRGLAFISTRDPEAAAEEIDRMANEKQIVGLYSQLPWADPALGDPKYDIMYQAAENNGLSFAFHSGGGGAGKAHFQGLPRAVQSYLMLHTVAHPMDHMLNLASIIYEGVPVKFPDLDFVWLEAGLGWAAYMMGRMNRDYSQRRFEAPLLDDSPEQYIRQSCYFGSQPMEEHDNVEHTKDLINMIGADSIIFGTDFPHFDFDNPNSLLKLFTEFSEEEKEQIFAKNAAEVFDISI